MLCWYGRSCTRPSCGYRHAGERGRPAEAPGADPAPTALSSFRDFVLRELGDDASPEVAAAEYCRRKQALARQCLVGLQGTRLLFDLYHPLSLLRRYDLRVRAAQMNAAAFVQDLQQGCYSQLRLRAASGVGASCPVVGHLLPPQFAYDADANTLLLGEVPKAASVWAVHDALVGWPGLVALSWPRPGPDGAGREVRARFSSARHAKAAAAELQGVRTQDGRALSPRAPAGSEELRALVVPPEMQGPERVRKDRDLSARVVRHLDMLNGIPRETTEALLTVEDGRDDEASLDLQVLYLRRAHHFCFYAAAWCEDEWELKARCGPALVRGCTEKPVAEGTWAAAHDHRLEEFLASAKLERPLALTVADEPVSSQAAKVLEARIQKVAEGKFRCTQCSKLFRGPSYVQRHLRRAHTELVDAVRQEAHWEAAEKAFLADPQRPSVEPLETSRVVS